MKTPQLDIFYNTTGHAGDILKYSKAKANTQNERVLAFFKCYPNTRFIADDVYNQLFLGSSTPLTSIRRAITTLAGLGLLIKTEITKVGMYGRPAHCYQLRRMESNLT